MSTPELAKIMLNERGGDAAFLVNGHKMPFIAPEYSVKPLGGGLVGVTVTFLADEVTVLSGNARRAIVREVVSEALNKSFQPRYIEGMQPMR